MAGWRDIKARAKATVHRTFEYPAVYLTHAAGIPIPCNVRVHSKVSVTQNDFTWPQTSGFLEMDPKIIFDQSEVPNPLPKAYVILSQTEIYRVGTPAPFRDGYAAAEVLPLSEPELSVFVAQVNFADAAYAALGA